MVEDTTMFGRDGEGLVLRYMMSKGRILVEVGALGDKLYGHAPSTYIPASNGGYKLISPDLLTINPRVTPLLWTQDNIWEFPFLWTEVKHKNTATFYRKKWRWQTGIDKRLYQHYCQIDKETGIPVWLIFLQRDDGPSNAPLTAPSCPTGLYGCPITQPYSDDWKDENYEKKGYRDMVYWGIEELLQLATLQQVLVVSMDAMLEDDIKQAPKSYNSVPLLTKAQVMQAWNNVAKRVRQKTTVLIGSHAVSAMLHHCKVLDVENDLGHPRIVLLPSSKSHYRYIKENQEAVLWALGIEFACDCAIRLMEVQS